MELDAAVPQITVFGLSMLFEKHLSVWKEKPQDFVTRLDKDPSIIWSSFVELIASKKTLKQTTSWPTLLKSGTFYRDVVDLLTLRWKQQAKS